MAKNKNTNSTKTADGSMNGANNTSNSGSNCSGSTSNCSNCPKAQNRSQNKADSTKSQNGTGEYSGQ